MEYILKSGKPPTKKEKEVLIPNMIESIQGDNFPTKYAEFRLQYQDEDVLFEYDK